MVSIEIFRLMALSFPETVELPHFQKTSFRVKKKIFATLDIKEQRAMVKLSLVHQSVFCSVDPGMIYPVPGGWGRKGATYIELKKIRKALLEEVMSNAYCTVAPRSLSERISDR